MLKYVDTLVTFSEVLDEISLCINITNCPCHCINCHSPYLAEDIGRKLDWGSLNALIHINTGITCVAFMGGDNDPKSINKLAEKTKSYGLKTCWYSGRDWLSPDVMLCNLNYLKLGPYKEECGPLTNKNTNQRFYKVENNELIDLTNRFYNKNLKMYDFSENG